MPETIFESIKRRLVENKGRLPTIAEESGVNIWTIRNILDGRVQDPGVSVCQKLMDYFSAKDAMIAKLRKTPAG